MFCHLPTKLEVSFYCSYPPQVRPCTERIEYVASLRKKFNKCALIFLQELLYQLEKMEKSLSQPTKSSGDAAKSSSDQINYMMDTVNRLKVL